MPPPSTDHWEENFMDWRRFDTCVYKTVCEIFPDEQVLPNQKVIGQYSRAKRHCDILVLQNYSGSSILIDAKFRYRKTDCQHVKEFINLVGDIGCVTGVLVASKGYTEKALQEVQLNPNQLDLELITIEDLVRFEPTYTYQISQQQSLKIRKPFGWIAKTQSEPYGSAVCHSSRYTSAEASAKLEILSLHNSYLGAGQSTEQFIERQNSNIQIKYPGAALFSYEKAESSIGPVPLCIIRLEILKAFEMTAYLSVGGIVVCLSMFSPDYKMLHRLETLKQLVATANLTEYPLVNTSSFQQTTLDP